MAAIISAVVNFSNIPSRIKFRLRREAAARLARRPLVMRNAEPLVSFTFDDFPRSAFLEGGAILQAHNLVGTFFASFGLMGQVGPTGEIFSSADLEEFARQKHELGCHTYDHYHAWDTATSEFEASIIRNREALGKHFPGAHFRTFSYPISCPRPGTKRRIEQYFSCCRGGGQTFNCGTLDLNHLNGFFIEQSRHDFGAIKQMIARNARERGWLIFATHDISDNPTRFGCTPSLFGKIVRCAAQSGATILSISRAMEAIEPISPQSPK